MEIHHPLASTFCVMTPHVSFDRQTASRQAVLGKPTIEERLHQSQGRKGENKITKKKKDPS